MLIANPLTAYTHFSSPEMMAQAYSKMTAGIHNFMGVMAILNGIMAAGIWTWNKWGIYGFYVVAAIVLCININVGPGFAGSSAGLIGAVIILFTTRADGTIYLKAHSKALVRARTTLRLVCAAQLQC